MSDDDKPAAQGAPAPDAPMKLLPSDDQAPAGIALGRAGASPASPSSPSPVVEPTPTVPAAEASSAFPAGSAAPPPAATAEAPLDRPEVQAGLAFAGGLLAAMILKRLGR